MTVAERGDGQMANAINALFRCCNRKGDYYMGHAYWYSEYREDFIAGLPEKPIEF